MFLVVFGVCFKENPCYRMFLGYSMISRVFLGFSRIFSLDFTRLGRWQRFFLGFY